MKFYQISGPPEREKLVGFDASFSTEYIYRAIVQDLSFELREEKLGAPLYKSYDAKDIEDSIAGAGPAIVAESENKMAGFAALRFESWNNRVAIDGIYVLPEYKRRGIGTALIKETVNYAKTIDARCLWLETQNINYPAVNFYLKTGFRFCGFDNSLYDPGTVFPGETALYFCMNIK